MVDAVPASHFSIAFTPAVYGLRAHVTGVNGTLETTLAYWRRIAEEVRQVRPSGILVVDDMDSEPLPPEELMKLVLSMRGEGMEDVRIAYVEMDAMEIPRVELAGLIAYEHGFVARVFDNEEAAAIWLRYGER